MSGIYGTRDKPPPRITIRSKSSPVVDSLSVLPLILNGAISSSTSTAEQKSPKTSVESILETTKIPYKMSGVVIERTRTRSGNSEHSYDVFGDELINGRARIWKEKGTDGSRDSYCNSIHSANEELALEKEVMERNYTSLMQQLASALIEKETLVYQVQLLGQAYGELKSQLTALAEKENCHPSRLECLRDERHLLADFIISLSDEEAKNKDKVDAQQSSSSMLRAQRDLWKNKFKASSLIIDELSNQRLFILRQFEGAQKVVSGLLDEKEITRKGLFETFTYLQEIKETLDPSDNGKYRHLAIRHTMDDLLLANQELAKALHKRLLNTTRTPSTRNPFADDSTGSSEPSVIPSDVEVEAIKINSIDTKAFAASNPCEDFQRLVNERAQAAGLPPPKMHNIVVNCCRRCEGQIKIV